MDARHSQIAGSADTHNWFNNRVETGLLVQVPTTAGTQATGTGATAVRVNVDRGIILVDGKVLEVAPQADLVLINTTSFMASGQSRVATIVYYRSQGDDTIYQKVFWGAAATTGSQVAPTDAEIEATMAPGTLWFRIAKVTANRTGDQALSIAIDNTLRPMMSPATVNRTRS